MSSMSATPDTRRQRHTTTNSNDDNDAEIPLPPYQTPIAPLTPAYQNALSNLSKSNNLKHLQTHIQHAAEKLTDSAGDVNERLTDVRERLLKSRKRNRGQFEDGQQENGHGDGDEGGERGASVGGGGAGGEEEKFQQTEEQVKNVTGKLEEEIRRIVDAEVLVDGLTGTLMDLSKEAEQATASASTNRRRRTRRRANPEDEETNDDDEEDEDYNDPSSQSNNNVPYTQTLTEKLTTDATNWSNQPLTQRYSTNNTYIGFYRIVHDAKHPGNDIPPLPHASTWFRHLEDPTAALSTQANTNNGAGAGAGPKTRRGRHSQPEPEEDEDVEIAREHVSLKCPLTLLPYQEPLTSNKCVHSFEKQAIMDMISNSPTTVPAPGPGGRNTRVRAAKCPVCSILLAAMDLRKDPVLLRRVRRMEAILQRENEDEEDEEVKKEEEDSDEDDGEGEAGERWKRKGRKSGITVASDEEDEDDEEEEDDEEVEEQPPVQIKRETTMSRGPSTAPGETDEE